MAQFASDAFTGTSGTVLQTYDSNWVEHSSSSGDDATIESNRVGSRSVGNTTKLYYHQGAPASADYSVSSDVYCVTNLGSCGVCGRINTGANTFYTARCDAAAGGYALYKAVSGTFTQLGSTSSLTFSSSTTYQVKLKMVGSTIELFKAGEGTATISVTDTAITAAGKSGLRHNANQTTGFHIDNFSADDLGGGGQTVSAGQVSETDTAQSVGASQQASVGQASEVDTAQSATPITAGAVGQVEEIDAALTATSQQASVAGQASEVDEAQAASSAQGATAGQASETDAAQPVSSLSAQQAGQVTEVDEALAAAYTAPGTVLQASEDDIALPVGSLQAASVGQVSEVDSAQSAAVLIIGAAGLALEIDVAQAVLPPVQALEVGQVFEIDTAQPVTASSAGGTASAAEVWGYVMANGYTAEENVLAIRELLSELHLIHGLTAGSPLSVAATLRSAGAVSQSIAESSGTVTVTRQ